MTNAGTTDSTVTPPTTHQPYKLMRARQGRMIAGVAAGLAKASGLDLTVVRICIGFSLLSGLGFVGYILLWIVLPDEAPARGREIEPAPENTARVIRGALVVAALLGVMNKVGIFWPLSGGHVHNGFGFDGVVGLILLSIGAGVLFSRHRPDRSWWEAPHPPVSTPPATPAPADDDTASLESADPLTEALAVEQPERRGGAALGWARVFGWFVLLWWSAGVLGFVALWRFGALTVAAPAVLVLVTWLAFTAVLNVLLRVRNPASVVATVGVLLVPLVVGAALVRTDGPVGSRIIRPTRSATSVRYRQAVGKLELDLSTTRFKKGATEISTRTGVGATIIRIPNDVSVTAVTNTRSGGYDVLGRQSDFGIGQRETLRFEGCEGAPHLRLLLQNGAGWMEVKRANGSATATCPAPA